MDDAGHVILRKRLPRDALMPFMTDIFQDIGGTDTITSATWGGSAEHQQLCCCGTPSGAARYACMDKPLLDLAQWAHADFYALIGRVSLLLVEHNIDAITVTMFLREIVDAGGDALSLAQVRHIASHYVDMASRQA